MADADQPFRENVDQESSQKLICGNRHNLLLAAPCVVFPAKRDSIILESNEPVVGDGDTVGVRAEIPQDMLRSSEGSRAVDDPVVAKQLSEPGGEDLGLGEELEVAMEAELALGESALQSGHELAAKHPTQHFVARVAIQRV